MNRCTYLDEMLQEHLLFIYHTVYAHVKSFTIVQNRKCGQVTSHCRTCIFTTARHPENFKVIGQGQGHMGFWVFFGVHDAAATRGQYLALSKA